MAKTTKLKNAAYYYSAVTQQITRLRKKLTSMNQKMVMLLKERAKFKGLRSKWMNIQKRKKKK